MTSNDATQPSQPESTARTILVTGATGKQGRSFISAVLSTGAAIDIRILALTRSSKSPAASALAASDRVTLVEADLDKPDTVRKVFEDAKTNGDGIWGVFLVLAYPGLGVDSAGEERQGKLIVDLSKEFGVQYLMYSSSERGDEVYDDTPILSKTAKVQIERHIKSLDGLRWTILRPTLFMENFDGFVGRITAAVFRVGLKEDTKLQLVSTDDIGHVALAIFLSPEPDTYIGQAIPVLGDALTMKEVAESYERGAGRTLPSIPGPIARVMLAMNKNVKDLLAGIEQRSSYRTSFESPDSKSNEALMTRCLALYPAMSSVEAWVRRRGVREQQTKRWNNVSLWDLIRGKL
ncbi:hypothetical protein ACEPAF_363 [Sanghuangporus sanghuang]